MVAAAVVGANVVGGVLSSNAQADAADSAANAQTASAQAQIAESRRQFDEIQKLLNPYVSAGTSALTYQNSILGINGPESQQAAVNNITNSPLYNSAVQQGEDSLLQNASATGGLRGGNLQGALAQFRPQLLQSMLDQQYNRLGGISSLGQNAAAGVGNAGQASSNQVISALGQQGAAQAGNALAQGKAQSSLYGGLSNAAGYAFGSNMFSGSSGAASSSSSSLSSGNGVGSFGQFQPSYGFGGSSGFGDLGSGFSLV